MVVPGRVEPLALLGEASGIELGIEDPLFVVERPGQIGAVGAEDGAAAAAEDPAPLELVTEREVRRIGLGPLEVARRDHERARLARDVDERRLPGIAVVGGRGDVELDAAAPGAAKVADAELARYLEREGRLVRLGDGYAVSAAAYERAKELLREELAANGRIALARFRDLAGCGRRDAQLLLERFDADGLTRRVGDERVARRSASPSA